MWRVLLISSIKEEEVYVHGACDENMKILEAAARLLSFYIRKHKIDGFNDHIEFDYQVKWIFVNENPHLLY